MTALWAIITELAAPFLPYIIVAIAIIGGLWGKAKLDRRKGAQDQKAKQDAANAKAHTETVERVLDETTSADPADAIRRRMRERAGKP